MRKTYLYIVAVIFLLNACEEEIIIDDIPINPHLVLNALLSEKDDTCRFYVTKSRPIFSDLSGWKGDYLKYAPLVDAKVRLSINGQSEELSFFRPDSAFIYTKRLRTNDMATVSVTHKGREINASTYIPVAPQILSSDTTSIYRVRNGSTIRFLQFNVKLKDDPTQHNYYRLLINQRYFYQDSWYPDWNYWKQWRTFYSEDPILTNGNPSYIDEDEYGFVTFEENHLGIFNDTLFNGQEYNLSFYIDYPDYFHNEYFSYSNQLLSVQIQTITEETYKYYKSLQHFQYLIGEDLNEPIKLFTNINNGLGFLGACNETTIIHIENKQ